MKITLLLNQVFFLLLVWLNPNEANCMDYSFKDRGLIIDTITSSNLYQECQNVLDLKNSDKPWDCVILVNQLLDMPMLPYLRNLYFPTLLNSKSLSYKNLGNPFLAEANALLTIQYLISQEDITNLRTAYSNLSSLYLKINESERAYRLMENIIAGFGSEDCSDLGIVFNNLCEGYAQSRLVDKAETIFAETLMNIDVFKQNKNFNPEITYRNYARFKLKQNKPIEAYNLFQKSLLESILRNGLEDFQTAKCYYHLGKCYNELGNLDSALVCYDNAIRIFEESLSSSNNQEYSYETSYIEIMTERGEFLMKRGNYEQAFKDLCFAVDRVDLFVNTYQAETTRFFIAEVGSKAFELGVLCYLRMHEGAQIEMNIPIEWSMKAKSLSLYYAFQRDYRYPQLGMPMDSLYKLQSMREEIQRWMDGIDVLSVQKEEIDTDELYHWVRKVVEYEHLEQYIQREYLSQHDKLESNPLADILTPMNFRNEVYLGYQDLDSLFVIIGVNKRGRFIEEIPCDHGFRDDIEDFKKTLRKPHHGMDTKSEMDRFISLSRTIYDRLFVPIEKNIISKSISIHSDGILLGLPFEVLLAEKPKERQKDYQNLPYLIHNYNFRYVATPFLQPQGKDVEYGNKKLMIGCLDDYSLGGDEVKNMSRFFTEDEIIPLSDLNRKIEDRLSSANEIHIISHLVTDQNDYLSSGLVCDLNEDNRYFTLKDILFRHLNHPDVFINSCESGMGPIINGEGLMSLSLGFAIAGSQSVIQHYWDADDEAASKIAVQYYMYRDHLSRSRALQKAKIKYLKNAPYGKTHPHYWAGVVYFGNRQKQHWPIWPFVVGGVILLTSILWRKGGRTLFHQ